MEFTKEQLIEKICESLRVHQPELRPDDYFRIRQRLEKMGVGLLQEVLETDVVATKAARLWAHEVMAR
jgi:hypothetical protein